MILSWPIKNEKIRFGTAIQINKSGSGAVALEGPGYRVYCSLTSVHKGAIWSEWVTRTWLVS